MTALFSKPGLKRLGEIVRPGLLCAFDFDGTLAPIVPAPHEARLPPELLPRLAELAEYVPVAIITGRSLEDMRARLEFDVSFIIGNHGIEGLPGWESKAATYRAICRGWRDQLAARLREPEWSDPGILIEDKVYSLSLHYRMARDPAQVEARLQALMAHLDPPPRVIAGKYVANMLPGDAAHKGGALLQLMKNYGARSALYVGDDVTDEDVFRLRRNDLLTVRIEPDDDSAADFYLPRQQDIASLLDELNQRLRALSAKNWERADIA